MVGSNFWVGQKLEYFGGKGVRHLEATVKILEYGTVCRVRIEKIHSKGRSVPYQEGDEIYTVYYELGLPED